ncbi:MAG: glycine/betaine ABC transporter substrate-binding protein [Blastocatellia bacterium AA13]|nr:MAG: glycine/betaine ABC transporter substrate-binding protein [Blastocatellia bacterium AA13]
MKLLDFIISNRGEVLGFTLEHLFLVGVAAGAAAIAGIPIGIMLTRRPSLSKTVLAAANVLQTIPSLALFGFLIPLLGQYGIGQTPAIIALFLYSLLPIIRNTFTGINGVDPNVREAARGMGMTGSQMLFQVELPLALNVIIAGLRVATVIAVGTATIAAAVGAGGLGTYIFRGLRQSDNTLILAGAVPAALLALMADWLFGFVERSFTPGANKQRARTIGWITVAAIVLIAGVWAVRGAARRTAANQVVIGSKDFTEQVILGELLAQTLESKAGLQVSRKFELGGDLCHRAMLEGTIDGYVEYTGTAFTSILKQETITDPREVYRRVKEQYETRFKLEWLDPLGFNNTFAILIRSDDARRLNLKSISDAARYTPGWRPGFGQDFMSRQDGYPGLAKAYGLQFKEPPREMDLALTYRALAAGQVDLIAGNSTDGLIDKLGLFQLEDDRRYFPPYEAAPVFRKAALELYPQIADAIAEIGGKLTDSDMRRLNNAVDGEHREVKAVVREFLDSLANKR